MKGSMRKLSAVALSVSIVMLAGCSSLVVKPVSEANKVESNVYDGRWVATGVNTASKQLAPGNWEFTCADRSGDRIGVIVVENGRAQFSWDEAGNSPAFVSKKGKFRFEIPTGVVAAAAGTSDSSISRGDMTALVYGSLESGKGKFTMGIAEFGNAGCTSTVEFKRL